MVPLQYGHSHWPRLDNFWNKPFRNVANLPSHQRPPLLYGHTFHSQGCSGADTGFWKGGGGGGVRVTVTTKNAVHARDVFFPSL